ncbi:hypothetical protein BJV74DRAFT_136552 [Russula compacta]|nr:hypothetical protein BJV74DRAFT_136552 [Russula compacta]
MSMRVTIGSRNDEPSTLPPVQSQGVAFLGPNALAAFISAIELGFVIACFSRFLARSEKERASIKVLVYFVTCVAIFQTGATFATWWKVSVLDFGNWSAAAVPAWPQKIHSVLTTLLAAPVQLFLIWRCWHLLGRRWFVALPLVLLVIGTVITTIYVAVILFLLQFQSAETQTMSLHTFFTCFVLSLAFSAAIDIAVTSILLVFLFRSRSKVYTRRFRKVLSQLIAVTWESAIPPCSCAIAALITCVAGAPFVSYWAVMLQVILGKLYLISLFVTLEGRATLADVAHHTHFPTLTDAIGHGTSSDPPDDAEQQDPTKESDLPLSLIPCKIEDVSNHVAIEGGFLDPDSAQTQEV